MYVVVPSSRGGYLVLRRSTVCRLARGLRRRRRRRESTMVVWYWFNPRDVIARGGAQRRYHPSQPPFPGPRGLPLAFPRRARYPFTPYHHPLLSFPRELDAPAGDEAGGVDYPKLAAASLRPRSRCDASPLTKIAPLTAPPSAFSLSLLTPFIGRTDERKFGGRKVNDESDSGYEKPVLMSLYRGALFPGERHVCVAWFLLLVKNRANPIEQFS